MHNAKYCPKCGGVTREWVRFYIEGKGLERHRECVDCRHDFKTYEVIEGEETYGKGGN